MQVFSKNISQLQEQHPKQRQGRQTNKILTQFYRAIHNMQIIEAIINDYLEELYNHIKNNYIGQCERDYAIGEHEITIVCDTHSKQAIVFDEDGTDVSYQYQNVCTAITKRLSNAWSGAMDKINTEDDIEDIDDWAQFGGYALGGTTITSRYI